MNTKETTTLLGINEHTLRKWEKDFNISVPRDKNGYRDFTEENIKTFEAIKALRNADNGIVTIQKRLGVDNAYIQENKPEITENKELNTEVIYRLNTIESSLISRLDNVLDLAKEYSKATFEIGKLQAEKAAIEEKLKLISDSNNKDISGLQKDLEKLKLENQALNAELEKEKQKPWYKKLFGK